MDMVEKVAEAVLYEGYLLYPYRRSAMKNQQRWTFGGVYPAQYRATHPDDPCEMQTECLVLGDANTILAVKMRFLQIVDRSVTQMINGTLQPVEELRVGEQVYRPWEEAIERTIVLHDPWGEPTLRLGDLLMQDQPTLVDSTPQTRDRSRPGLCHDTPVLHGATGATPAYENAAPPDPPGFIRPSLPSRIYPEAVFIPAGSEKEPLHAADGSVVGALLRTWHTLRGAIEVAATPLPDQPDGAEPCYRLTVRILNTTPGENHDRVSGSGARPEALRHTFVATHTILTVRHGEFVSLLEPPAAYQRAAAACSNLHTWPVLVGELGERHTLLSSPIILYDYPRVSAESPGNLFDATEIDELLTLSVLTLTDEEKREMRQSDPRGREILERTESLTPEQVLRLHASVRSLQTLRQRDAVASAAADPFLPWDVQSLGLSREEAHAAGLLLSLERPAPSSITVRGVEVHKGSRVRLHPRRGGDILDLALAGKIAHVEAIDQDYEDRIHLAVMVEDDPGRDLGDARQPGHRFFFSPEEVEPLPGEGSGSI
jgi:hypothetical protein